MKEDEIKQILLEDLSNKKEFDALFDTTCDGCGADIEEGSSFIFMGDKQKICPDCRQAIEYVIEDNIR